MICYTCGATGIEQPFCNDECHEKWIEAHPRPEKKFKTISEIQERILSWTTNQKRWRPAFAEEKQLTDDEVISLFQSL